MIRDQAVGNAKCIQYYREAPNHVLQSHRVYTHSGSLYCYAKSEIRLLGSVDDALDGGLMIRRRGCQPDVLVISIAPVQEERELTLPSSSFPF